MSKPLFYTLTNTCPLRRSVGFVVRQTRLYIEEPGLHHLVKMVTCHLKLGAVDGTEHQLYQIKDGPSYDSTHRRQFKTSKRTEALQGLSAKLVRLCNFED